MTDADITIRLARPDEADAARGLVRAAYRHYVPRMGREPGPMRDDYAAHQADGALWVCEHAGALAGVLVLCDHPDHLLLDNVAVSPAAQGLGLGRRLIDFAEAEARRRGYREIALYTHETMTENQALYLRLGWQEFARREEKGYQRIYYRKPLEAAEAPSNASA